MIRAFFAGERPIKIMTKSANDNARADAVSGGYPTTDAAPQIDDVRIVETRELVRPDELIHGLPAAPIARHIAARRDEIHRVLTRASDRLLVVVGPCSIHGRDVALAYAEKLLPTARELAADLLVVMRVYFEKPRTAVGWKGLINDPNLDGSFKINDGLRLAREILIDINKMGLACGTEFLDVITPQYYADLIGWGAIGARTTESQIHRELASGLSCPIGFKNGTDGNIKIAVDAIRAASQPHHFLSVTKRGRSAISTTTGNENCHVILRGGGGRANYDAQSVETLSQLLAKAALPPRAMIDCSHANSGKDPAKQAGVSADVARQVAGGDYRVVGAMIESHLVAGRQECEPGRELVFGQSITDGCAGWEETETMLRGLAEAVQARRRLPDGD